MNTYLMNKMANTRHNDQLEFALELADHESLVQTVGASENQKSSCFRGEELGRQIREPSCDSVI